MLYKRSFRWFWSLTAALAVLRCVLKVLFVDTETGFYLGARPLELAFDILLAAVVFGLWIASKKEPDEGFWQLRGNRWLEILAVAMGGAVLGTSLLSLGEALRMDPNATVINALPRWLLLIEHTLGILSGLVWFYLAIVYLSGARRSGTQGMLLLLPVLWQALNMVQRFISFRQVNTASDQLLETLFLLSATLFLLAHTRCVAGVKANRRACLLRALLTAAFGIPLVAGQLAATAVLGEAISGPSSARLAVILATSLYALFFALELARGPKPE